MNIDTERYKMRLDNIRREAELLLQFQVSHRESNYELVPLALGLRHISNLYSVLFGLDERVQVSTLFDGGETGGPNLDTRFRQIRDLLDAVTYDLVKKSETQQACASNVCPAQSPGLDVWQRILAPYIAAEHAREISMLLDDVYESAIHLAEMLSVRDCTMSQVDWSEVSRHVSHIVDHAEYAEDILISVIRKAEDGGEEETRA